MFFFEKTPDFPPFFLHSANGMLELNVIEPRPVAKDNDDAGKRSVVALMRRHSTPPSFVVVVVLVTLSLVVALVLRGAKVALLACRSHGCFHAIVRHPPQPPGGDYGPPRPPTTTFVLWWSSSVESIGRDVESLFSGPFLRRASCSASATSERRHEDPAVARRVDVFLSVSCRVVIVVASGTSSPRGRTRSTRLRRSSWTR